MVSLPIPDCYFTLSLILFNISFGLLCSDPAQPISATEGADKSIPPMTDHAASSPAERVAKHPPCPAAPAQLGRPQPCQGASHAGSMPAPSAVLVPGRRCVIYTLGSCPQGKSDKHTISFDTNSVYKILLLRDRLAYSHRDATSCNKMELLFYSSLQLLLVSAP